MTGEGLVTGKGLASLGEARWHLPMGAPPAGRKLSWAGVGARGPVHQEHGLKGYLQRALQGCALCCRPP